MRWSRKGSTQTALQKAYDEAYANSLNSILLETNNQSDEALVAWTTTLEGIARNIGELDAAAPPKSSAEKSLMANLLDIERQCHDRISYLESRRDSVGSYQSPPQVPPYSAGQSAIPGQYGGGYAHSSEEDLRPYNPYHSNSSLQLGVVPPTPPPHTVGSASNVSLHATAPSARHQYSGSVGSAEAYGSLLSANNGSNGPNSTNSTNSNNMYNMKARSASELMAASNAASSQGPKKMLETLRSSSGGRARGSNASRGRTAHSGLQAAALAWGDTGGGSSSSAQQAQQAQQVRTSSLGSNNGGFDKMSMRGAGYGFRSRPTAGSTSSQSQPQPPPPQTRSPFDDNSQLLVDLESSDSDRASPPQDSAPRPSRSAPPPRPPKPASLPRTIKLEHAYSSSTVPTARAPSPPKGVSPKETVALAATAMKNAKPPTKLQPAVTLAQMRQHQQAIQSQAARAQPRPQGRWVITSTTPKQGARGTSPSKPTQSSPQGQAAKPRPKRQPAASPEPEPESPPNEEDEWMKMAREKIKGLRGVDPQAAEQILNEIVHHGDEVRWEDIAGLERAKASLKETVVYPFLRPDLFSGLREPAQGMLLFGPPGTGKTMLARAVATESKSTFFSISASSLTSKFLGESEKLVRALFQMARALAPSIIFVDEIDSLLSSRSEGGEHEASRRIKTEFLVQWSDLQHAAAGKAREDLQRVLVLAATNLPWAIDEAARRRFVRRQYIPLPERTTREVHIKKLLAHQKHAMSESDFGILLDMTDGFSGSDMTALAKDAAMGPLRALGEALLTTPTDQIRPMGLEDFIESLKTIRPSVSREGLKAFEDWATMYGSSGA